MNVQEPDITDQTNSTKDLKSEDEYKPDHTNDLEPESAKHNIAANSHETLRPQEHESSPEKTDHKKENPDDIITSTEDLKNRYLNLDCRTNDSYDNAINGYDTKQELSKGVDSHHLTTALNRHIKSQIHKNAKKESGRFYKVSKRELSRLSASKLGKRTGKNQKINTPPKNGIELNGGIDNHELAEELDSLSYINLAFQQEHQV